jgi:branched-chain amino acid transport system substrate-binding protein
VKVPSLTLEANWETMALKNKWTWMANGGLIQNTYSLGIYAYEDLGYRKVSALYPEVSGGPDFFRGFKMGFNEKGGEIIQEQVFSPQTQDFIPYLINVKKDADALWEFAVGAFSFPFFKAMQEVGFKKPTIEGPGELPNPEVVKAIGDVLIGKRFITSYFYTLDTPGNKAFVAAYKKRWGELPAHLSGCGYSAAQIAIEALRQTGGDTSGEALSKALGRTSINSVRGRVTLTPDRVGTLDYFAGEIAKVKGEYTYEYLKKYRVKMARVGDKLEYSVVK